MEQFLQAYGGWIVLGLFFLFMLRLHGSGSGCGMGHDDHRAAHDPGRREAARDASTEETGPARDAGKEGPTAAQRSGGCH